MSERGTQVPYMWRRGMDLVWILNGYSPGTVSKKLARRSNAPQDMLEDLLLHHWVQVWIYPKVGMDSRRALYESNNEVWI